MELENGFILDYRLTRPPRITGQFIETSHKVCALRLRIIIIIIIIIIFALGSKDPEGKNVKLKSKFGMARGPILRRQKQSSG